MSAVLDSYAYDPFGISLRESETVANPFQFAGEFGVKNDGSVAEFMRTRFYSERLGQFLQEDPIGTSGGDANLRRYVDNNPVAFIDPMGLWRTKQEEYTPFDQLKKEEEWEKQEREKLERQLHPEEKQINPEPPAPTPAPSPSPSPDPYPTPGPNADDFDVHKSRDTLHIPPLPPPIPPPRDPQKQQRPVAGSLDPNDKLAPGGFGDAAYIRADSSLAYEVRFENESAATAPARLVSVTDTLDPSLDLSTFELTEIDFANQSIIIPSGLDSYDAMVSMTTPTGASIVVNVQARLDHATRVLSLILQALDPATGWYSDDPEVGLLYPENGSNRGVGLTR
jgi:RHS repeat-associated protein